MACVIGTALIAACGASSSTGGTSTGPTLKIAFLYNSPHNDSGWSSAHDVARLALEQAYPGQVTTLYKESVPESPQVTQIIDSLVQSGVNVIFAASYGFHKYVGAAAAKYPNVKFFQMESTELGPNLSEYNARIEDASYLAGMAAGAAATNGKLGMTAEFPIPNVVNFVNAFALGAKATNPNATVRVIWTNSWYDPATETLAARSLVSSGVTVLAQNEDSPSTGQVAESAGVPFVGSFWKQLSFAPTQYLTSSMYTWSPYYIDQVGQILKGTWKSSDVYLSMKEQGIAIDSWGPRYSALVPAAVQAQIDATQKQLVAGTFDVYSGPIYDNKGALRIDAGKQLPIAGRLSMDWFVANVQNG